MNFDKSYFKGNFVPNPNPAGYGDYNENTEDFYTTARILSEKAKIYMSNRNKILVLGCAYGFTVKYLLKFGIDAYGMDISKFAVSQAPKEISSRIVVGDASKRICWDNISRVAKLDKGQKFDLIFDEDMICCLSNEDARMMCDISKHMGEKIFHVLTLGNHLRKWYNYHTIKEWKRITLSNDISSWFEKKTWIEE